MSDSTLEWRGRQSGGAISGVALVVHGLNVKPRCMLPLTRELNGWGVETVSCALMGHGANYLPVAGLGEKEARLAALGRVTYHLWHDEVTAAYRIAALRAVLKGVPLILVAFSLGGAIGCAIALETAGAQGQPGGRAQFAKLVFFAPALRVHRRSKVLWLLSRWPRLAIPSAAPAACRANRSTTIAAYNALYAAQAHCELRLGEQLNVPALVFVDPQDELVSAAGLMRLAAERHLTRWQFYRVHKEAGATTRYHHLLIDADSVGASMWTAMMARLRQHLAL